MITVQVFLFMTGCFASAGERMDQVEILAGAQATKAKCVYYNYEVKQTVNCTAGLGKLASEVQVTCMEVK